VTVAPWVVVVIVVALIAARVQWARDYWNRRK
jgi:hypothetical protein